MRLMPIVSGFTSPKVEIQVVAVLQKLDIQITAAAEVRLTASGLEPVFVTSKK